MDSPKFTTLLEALRIDEEIPLLSPNALESRSTSSLLPKQHLALSKVHDAWRKVEMEVDSRQTLVTAKSTRNELLSAGMVDQI